MASTIRTFEQKGDERRVMRKDIKVKVVFTDGYRERFTKACLEQLEKRRIKKEVENAK